MSLVHSGIITLKDRGPVCLLSAVTQLLKQNIASKLFGKSYIQKKIHNYRMWLDVNDRGISRTLTLFGTREVEHKIMLEHIVKPGMRIYDIGANIGYYALMELGLLKGKGELIAIEPSTSNVALLKRNLGLNNYTKQVKVLEGAVSDQPGIKKFYLSNQSNLNTFHTGGTGAAHLSGKTLEVKTFTVPELSQMFGPPDLIRMDVEGHEVEVINGMLMQIKNNLFKPMILFETHLSRYSKEHNMHETLERLFNLGYYVPMLASSWQRGTDIINAKGYKGSKPIATDGVKRVIYNDIDPMDAIEFICDTGGARTVLLAPKEIQQQLKTIKI